MKRVIVSFKKLTPEIMAKLVEKYPDGYGDKDIISFKNAKGETIDAVELKTEEITYLVKVSTRLQDIMSDFDADEYEADDFDVPLVDLPMEEDSED